MVETIIFHHASEKTLAVQDYQKSLSVIRYGMFNDCYIIGFLFKFLLRNMDYFVKCKGIIFKLT